MAGGIRVQFTAVTDKFTKGVAGMTRDLRKFGDEATRTGAQGEAAGSNLSSGFQRRIERQFRNRRLGKRLGTEFAQDFTQGLSSGNPVQSLTNSILAIGPALGAAGLAVAAGGAFILNFAAGMEKKREAVKAAGVASFEAFRDGLLTAAEKEAVLNKLLGVDDTSAAIQKAQKLATELGAPVLDVYNYLLSAGEVSSGKLNTALAANKQELDDAARYGADNYGNLSASAVAANTLQGYATTLATQTDKAAYEAGILKDSIVGTKEPTESVAKSTERVAAAAKLAADDFARFAALAPSVASALAAGTVSRNAARAELAEGRNPYGRNLKGG